MCPIAGFSCSVRRCAAIAENNGMKVQFGEHLTSPLTKRGSQEANIYNRFRIRRKINLLWIFTSLHRGCSHACRYRLIIFGNYAREKEIQKKEMAKKEDGSYARHPSSLIANRVQGSSCCEGLKN